MYGIGTLRHGTRYLKAWNQVPWGMEVVPQGMEQVLQGMELGTFVNTNYVMLHSYLTFRKAWNQIPRGNGTGYYEVMDLIF